MAGVRTRRAGLSNKTRVEPLLKLRVTPSGTMQRVYIDAEPLSNNKDEDDKAEPLAKSKDEEDIPPPMSSSEDEDDCRGGSNQGAGRRGDIARTMFAPKGGSRRGIQPTSKNRGIGVSDPIEDEEEPRLKPSRRQPPRNSGGKRKAADDDAEITNSFQRIKKSKSGNEKPLSQHDEDDPFERNDLNRTLKVKYGSKSSKTQRKAKTPTRASHLDDIDEDTPKPTFRRPPTDAFLDDSSPEKSKRFSRKGLRARDSSPSPKHPTFRRPPPDTLLDDSSPEKSKKFSHKELQARDSSEAPSPNPVLRMPRADTDKSSPQPQAPKSKVAKTEKPKPQWQVKRDMRKDKRSGASSKPEAPEPEAEEMSQAPVFKLPPGFDDSQADFTGPYPGDDVQLTDDMPAWTSVPDTDTPSCAVSTPVCPMCKGDVDQDALDAFRKQGTVSFDRQLKFCISHKKKSAEKTWIEKDYPDIKWGCLEARIAKHYPFLKSILEGASCHFRDKLDKKVAKGEFRTLEKSRDRITPGYYGLRGQHAMSESIIGKFSQLLRARAVEDSSVSARGYTSFVQAVMVPELAVKLIMEDMGVNPEKARDILYESADVGELLNEDEVDVVAKDVESDDQSESELSDLTEVMDLVDDSE